MPIFPYLSILAAYPIVYILKILEDKKMSSVKLVVRRTGIVSLIFIYPFIVMFNKSQSSKVVGGERIHEADELFIFNSIKDNKDLNGVKVYYHGWNGSLLFYKYKLQEMNQNIELNRTANDFGVGDKVLVSNDSLLQVLNASFTLNKIDEYGTSILYNLD
jgi:hypothetical protein